MRDQKKRVVRALRSPCEYELLDPWGLIETINRLPQLWELTVHDSLIRDELIKILSDEIETGALTMRDIAHSLLNTLPYAGERVEIYREPFANLICLVVANLWRLNQSDAGRSSLRFLFLAEWYQDLAASLNVTLVRRAGAEQITVVD